MEAVARFRMGWVNGCWRSPGDGTGYFVTRGPYTMMSLTYWIQRDSFDALIWGILGALTVGGVVYAIKAGP
jgi:hypothetical protein